MPRECIGSRPSHLLSKKQSIGLSVVGTILPTLASLVWSELKMPIHCFLCRPPDSTARLVLPAIPSDCSCPKATRDCTGETGTLGGLPRNTISRASHPPLKCSIAAFGSH